MKRFATILAACMLLAAPAHADWISEIGVGYKLNNYSSALFDPDCEKAEVVRPNDFRPWRHVSSCGGDNPIFAGWVISYQWDHSWGYQRFGWWHLSSWFDGANSNSGDGAELHMDCACYVAGFNWTKIRSNMQ